MCGICWGEGVCGIRGQWAVFSQSTVYICMHCERIYFLKINKESQIT